MPPVMKEDGYEIFDDFIRVSCLRHPGKVLTFRVSCLRLPDGNVLSRLSDDCPDSPHNDFCPDCVERIMESLSPRESP